LGEELCSKICEKSIPQSEVLVELDAMWYFLCSRKTRFGFGRRIVELPENWWIGNVAAEGPDIEENA
jgi:hypothetical protein